MSADEPPRDFAERDLSPASASLPDNLPPIEPPSAGFIVQLFLVPAIIVAIVIGVYLLFGRIAAGETDWRQMVSDIKSDNPNVRWRAALNLAEALDAESSQGAGENKLADNPEIATALNDLGEQLLKSTANDEERIQQLQFVLKAIGRMDAVESVTPALREALEPAQDLETRKQALQAVAMIAGRRREQDQILDQPQLTDAVIDASTSSDAVLRQHAAFTMGLLPGAATDARLSVLLQDPDEMTRINAAIAFARDSSPRGLPVLMQALRDTKKWAESPSTEPDAGDRSFERQIILKNALLALSKTAANSSASDKAQAAKLLEELEGVLPDAALRLEVKKTRLELEAS